MEGKIEKKNTKDAPKKKKKGKKTKEYRQKHLRLIRKKYSFDFKKVNERTIF